MEANHIMLLTTVRDEKEADKITKELVKQKLAACAQIYGPIKSKFMWKQEVQEDEEWMCFIKSREDLFEDVEKKIKSLHSYENPEIISFDISDASEEYEKWMTKILR